MINYFDLAIAWDWEYDKYFVYKIEEILQNKGLKTYRIEYHNISETLIKLKKRELHFGYFLDRTNAEDYLPISKYLEKSDTCFFNQPKLVKKAIDKATMHLEFITGGINVPNTIILSPYNEENSVSLSQGDLDNLRYPFVIKPANDTGGSSGVITNATGLNEIIEARKTEVNNKYLVQEKVYPKIIDNRRAWFRSFHAFDRIFLTWWDDYTHRYETLSEKDEETYRLYSLRKVMASIRNICNLDFFSSEICVTNMNKIIVVDYVNEICDMRPQSLCCDGVPDQLINQIIFRLSDFLKIKRN
jgi:hypothetical protein